MHYITIPAIPNVLWSGGELINLLNRTQKGRFRCALCLQQQILAFGDALQNQYVDASSECQRYGSNHSVFDQLPPVFTIDDLRALKRGLCSEAALRKITSRWNRDQWIEKADKTHWKKLSTN